LVIPTLYCLAVHGERARHRDGITLWRAPGPMKTGGLRDALVSERGLPFGFPIDKATGHPWERLYRLLALRVVTGATCGEEGC
jgi:hypothetical protein